ncbi:MAG: glycoside hydrolase family 13 protein [Micromonosporaceae bacterium]
MSDSPADIDKSSAWWREAVIYQVYVRSFADSDGDGIGDLAGIRSRLPYLSELGVDAVWITPFYVSPMADGGYDVADYRDVDPTLGTLADFDALLADAHQRGIRVIVDIVPNHSSSEHPWFVEALRDGPGSPARERYLFRPGKGEHGELPPNDWESVFGGSAWSRVDEPDGSPGEWHLHLFAPEQPDLNWANTQVRDEFADILRFWLERGVDGFRVDVAHGMIKDPTFADAGREGQTELLGVEQLPYFDQDDVHQIYRDWRKLLDSYPGERIGVAEAWVAPDRLGAYVRPDELHQAFNFDYLTTDWNPEQLRAVIDSSLAGAAAVGAPTTWVLSNHDVVRHVTRYGDGELGRRRAGAAALLMLALPGSAYVYQGEELGLPEVTDLPDEVLQDPVWKRSGGTRRGRDGCRVPIPWEGAAPPYGFGSAGSWLPMPEAWRELTAQAQHDDPDSMLSLYRAALRLRREHPALGDGQMRWLPAPDGALVFARDPGFICAVNFGDQPVDLPDYGATLCASGPVWRDGGTVLPAATAVWFAR